MAAPGGVEPLFQVSELYDAGYDALVTPALCGAHKFSAVAVVDTLACHHLQMHTLHTHTPHLMWTRCLEEHTLKI